MYRTHEYIKTLLAEMVHEIADCENESPSSIINNDDDGNCRSQCSEEFFLDDHSLCQDGRCAGFSIRPPSPVINNDDDGNCRSVYQIKRRSGAVLDVDADDEFLWRIVLAICPDILIKN